MHHWLLLHAPPTLSHATSESHLDSVQFGEGPDGDADAMQTDEPSGGYADVSFVF